MAMTKLSFVIDEALIAPGILICQTSTATLEHHFLTFITSKTSRSTEVVGFGL